MSRIKNSVGAVGANDPNDVTIVQRLLNARAMPPYRPLNVNGICDEALVAQIRHFQEVYVRMNHPDGRVDPSGRSFAALRATTDPEPPKREPETPLERKEAARRRSNFVGSKVASHPGTDRIIHAIEPYFDGVNALVISGYLSDGQKFWKMNYHWDHLLWMVDHCLELDVDEKCKNRLSAIRGALMANKPNPSSGYLKSPTIGKPEDKSAIEEMRKRYQAITQGKQEFKKLMREADLQAKSKRPASEFKYTTAPLAFPTNSKHGTGYALDIRGDNGKIVSISKRLGASLTFDEDSHVHVEFKRGVSLPS